MDNDQQVTSKDEKLGGPTDIGGKGPAYPAEGNPSPQSDDSQGGGGGTDPGSKGSGGSYPGMGR